MILATTHVVDWELFWTDFTTVGAERRARHGCNGALVFRDDAAPDRAWIAFDWDESGWWSFVRDLSAEAVRPIVGPHLLTFLGAIEA